MRRRIPLLALAGLLLPGAAAAQGAHGVAAEPPAGEARPRSEAARARYPQPVLVGTLAGRQLLENTPRQRVLGRVAGVTRGGDGRISVLVDQGGILGLGTRRVAVPVEAVALLGPFVVLMDLDPAALAALPLAGAPGAALPPGDTVRVGLARN